MKYLKYLSLPLLIFIGVFTTGKLFFALTDGFTIDNITSEFAYREHWIEPKSSSEERDLFLSVMNQKFHYLGRGAQAYAFLSDDGKYVLKIVKQKHLKLKKWEDLVLRLPFLSSIREGKLARRKAKVENVLNSSKISFEDLKNETILIYMHLKKTDDLNTLVTITDKLGIPHTINLDDMEFVVQKKADLALPYLENLLAKGDTEAFHKALRDIIDLRVKISQQGIRDKDTGFLNNMGFFEEKPVIIDIGQFAKDATITQRDQYKMDLVRKTQVLRGWLSEHDHETASLFEQQLETLK